MGWSQWMPAKVKRQIPGGKRYPLNVRTTLEMRRKIEAAAHASGRSLVQELEHRLEQSFNDEKLDQTSRLDTTSVRFLTRLVALTTVMTETRTGKVWKDDAATAAELRVALELVTRGATSGGLSDEDIQSSLSAAPRPAGTLGSVGLLNMHAINGHSTAMQVLQLVGLAPPTKPPLPTSPQPDQEEQP